MSRDDDLQREKFSLAAHLYSRLRRGGPGGGGRTIDVIQMTRDDRYAREVLELALANPDPKTREYAEQYALLLGGKPKAKPAPLHLAPVSPRQAPMPTAPAAPANAEAPLEPPPANRYVRSLR